MRRSFAALFDAKNAVGALSPRGALDGSLASPFAVADLAQRHVRLGIVGAGSAGVKEGRTLASLPDSSQEFVPSWPTGQPLSICACAVIIFRGLILGG